jgi:hypothetical protein
MKKTQRDKDWPMIRRLIETDISRFRENPGEEQLLFWFLDCRTPLMLADLARAHPQTCRSLTSRRPLLGLALSGELAGMEAELRLEEQAEREKDRAYWLPLKRDLERWRKSGK